MSDLHLSLACQSSDRTRALLDGRVAIEGVSFNWVPVDPEEIFHRAFRHQEFDVSEISLSTHMAMTARGGSPFVGVPVFLSRVFRHSAIYIRTDRGITGAADLAGRKVGVPDYQQTAGLWVRGLLLDQYGVRPGQIEWWVGGQEQAGREPRTRLDPPEGIVIRSIPSNETLSSLLIQGQIEAIISPRAPSCLSSHPHIVARLFPDYRAAEEKYFRTTRMFPLMHALGIRKELAARHPWLAVSLFKAFQASKDMCMRDLLQVNFLRSSLPWLGDDVRRVQALMGEDYWRYGVAENQLELDAMRRYAFEDGLTPRIVEIDELFAPSTVGMFKI
jgi:4,5-dihydroxyphthalate decarboxylase